MQTLKNNAVKKNSVNILEQATVLSDRLYLFKLSEGIKSKGYTKSDAYLNYREKWTKNPKDGIVENFPLHLDIELTSRCNLHCKFCNRTSLARNHHLLNGDMSMDTYKRIIDECKGALKAVKLNFRGEPLLYGRLVEAVDYAKKNGVLDIQLNTNSMLMTSELAQALMGAGLDCLIFSIDSTEKESYEANRVGARFEKLVESILSTARIRDKGGYHHVCLRGNTVFTDTPRQELEGLNRLFSGALDEAILSKENPTLQQTGIDLEACKEQFSKIQWRCTQSWQRMAIFFNGDVVPCCVDFEGDMVFGNINNKGIHDLWHASFLKKLRKFHQDRCGYRMKRCFVCHNFIYQVIHYYETILGIPYPKISTHQ